jgi:hypothetical protein
LQTQGEQPVVNGPGGAKEPEGSVDFNNLTNNNVAWNGRSLSGTITLRQNGDPNGAINTVPQFGSSAQVFGPRNIRFNVVFRFFGLVPFVSQSSRWEMGAGSGRGTWVRLGLRSLSSSRNSMRVRA